jgi:ABC-type bacteriocin/lantibiotic exporter with double-glycine peptidase domain
MPQQKNDNSLLWKYAALSTQLLVAIGLSVFFGIKIDKWLQFKSPLLVWVLPLVVIAAIIYKVIKDTAPKK